MKKLLKISSAFLLIAVLILSMASCAFTSNDGSTQSKSEKEEKKEQINIEDIAWEVKEGIVDSKRYAVFGYTNNTPFTITEIQIDFKFKDDTTEESKNDFYSYIKECFEYDDEDMIDVKEHNTIMNAHSDKLVKPTESVSNVILDYFSGYMYVNNFSYYSLLEPDIVEIKYVKDEQILTTYYDFNSKNYSESSEIKPACEWSTNQLASLISKPQAPIIKNNYDYETSFGFEAFGMTNTDYLSYVEDCKTKGFNLNVSSFGDSFFANNEAGNRIQVSYDDKSNSIAVSISASNED